MAASAPRVVTALQCLDCGILFVLRQPLVLAPDQPPTCLCRACGMARLREGTTEAGA